MTGRKQMFARQQQDVEEAEGMTLVVRPEVAELRAPVAASALAMAERAVVGAILNDNTLYDAVSELVFVEDFSELAPKAAFACIGDILEGKVDGISVADAIAVASQPSVCQLAPLETLQAWMLVGDENALTSHAQVVRNAAAERRLEAAVEEAQTIRGSDGTVEERASSIQQKLEVVSEARSLQVTNIGAAAILALTQIAEQAQNGQTGVGLPTGFVDLDALLAGLHPGQLIVIAARPGVGKTAFAMSMLLALAAAGHGALLVSLEMMKEELSKRALSIISRVDGHAIRIGALTEADWTALLDAAEYMSKLPFDVIDMASVSLSPLFAKCRRLKREGKLSALVVDYLQIMDTSAGRNSTREQDVAALSRGLKKLGMALKIPVIALSQLNRSIENRVDRRPKMSDLRESGAIEQDADVIMFIHREEPAPGVVVPQELEDTAEIIVEKQRSGATGVVRVGFDKRTTRFYCLTTAANAVAPFEKLAA